MRPNSHHTLVTDQAAPAWVAMGCPSLAPRALLYERFFAASGGDLFKDINLRLRRAGRGNDLQIYDEFFFELAT